MRKQVIYSVQSLLLWSILYSMAYCQTNPLSSSLLQFKATSDSINKNFAAEKVYLQFDKPYYALGDTIWFKAWLINAPTYLLSAKSGLLHIDIANDSNKVIKQYLLPIQAGVSWGNITLDDNNYKAGTYIIRAYTNWMRNFGEDNFFYKRFYISSNSENNLLVNTRFNTSTVNGNNIVNAKMLFSSMDNMPFALQALKIHVINGSRQLYTQKLQTGVDGVLDVNFKIPQKTSGLVITAESEQKDKKLIIPVSLNQAENTDVQFLPEGGNLVSGINMRIGFKAIGEDGKGRAISGIITDQDQKQVATFQSMHNGIGSFNLIVSKGKSYTAKVKLADGLIKEYPLPVIKSAGTVLQADNNMESDSVTISFSATNDIAELHESYFLIGKARGVICYAAILNFSDRNKIVKSIAKTLFPSGITSFIVTKTNGQVLNERLVYIDHHDNLHIAIETDKDIYKPKDSVALHLKVMDNEGNPVLGNFSLAVTDDGQVKVDTSNNENIITRLLLTSDLKGYIEQPGYYFSKTAGAWQALDNLLLTQGWTTYGRLDNLDKPKITYQPEHEFEVKGNVYNVFNKPVTGTKVFLFSKSPFILMDTITDKGGEFIFNHFPIIDTPVLILKAVNKHGKSFNVGITVDETKPPEFTDPDPKLTEPWYVNSDTTMVNFTKNTALAKQLQYFTKSGHILKEVKISAKKIIKDSQNLNGAGNADQIISEQEIEKAGKKTVLQLLMERIPGFKESFMLIDGPSLKAAKNRILSSLILDNKDTTMVGDGFWYYIEDKPVKFIIDGISLYKIMSMTSPAISNINSYLNSIFADDIKGIEVMRSSKYASRYIPIEWGMNINMSDMAFIEITTRSGHGPAINSTPGIYLYKPLPISRPIQFYKPKYKLKDTVKYLPDFRSTIDWEPNIITNVHGEAIVSFYTGNKPSTYTIVMEGIDFNGNFGFQKHRIKLEKTIHSK